MTPETFEEFAAATNLESLCHAAHIETGTICLESDEKARSQPQLIAYSVEVFFGTTCNGGFDSLFSGAYLWTVKYLSEALRTIELTEYASVMDTTCEKIFQHGIPESETEHSSQIEKLWKDFEDSPQAEDHDDPFEILEEGFWELYNDDPTLFRKRLHKYICDNRQHFC